MLLVVLVFAVLYVAGYTTRSYVGVLIPLLLFALAIVSYLNAEPTGDEMDAIPGAMVIFTAIGVLIYLGGVALGRRTRTMHE
jgi:NhaP-type Na+/H+ or K+/H+ antiporter